MLWFKKQPEAAPARDEIAPAALPLPFDARLFEQHFAALADIAAGDAGIDAWLAALNAKQQLFATALAADAMDAFDLEQAETLLDFVSPARRRVFPVLQALGDEACRKAVRELVHGNAPLASRMQAFAGLAPSADGGGREAVKNAQKVRRALADFAAELLHYNDPVRYPLMTRWVWDQSAESGALREFIRGADAMPNIELGASPELFEGARRWLAERIGEQGIYRDVHFWIDMVQAQAYASYFRSVAEGLLSAEFGRGGGPEEHVKRFLGIDDVRRDGASRVRKAPVAAL